MPEEEREKIEGGEEPPEEETTESRPPHRRGVEITQRLSPRPDDIYLQIDLATLPIGALVETLAQQAELKVEWSPLARETVVGRQSRIAVAESSLAFLLDGLLDPLDLFWRTEGDRILVDAYETLSAEAVRSFRTTTAERALHHAIITFPDHGWVDEAYWSLGNLAFVTGRYAAAELHYQQHARQFPRIPGSVDIRFNLAKTLLALQQPVGALDNFYYVIDSGPEQPAAPAAYLYAGRLHTENDEPRRAVKPLMRAIALARDQNQRATATLAVATAYMLDDKPHAANQMLMEFREEIRDAKHLDQAAFLAAAARYRSARFDTQIEHEARALVMSLSHVKPGDFFGFGAHRLMVESQHDLQLFEDMHATLASSVATAGPGGMRDHLMFMLGRAENEAGRTAQAAEVFSALSGVGGEPWSSHADIELARLAIADRDTNAAFAACRRLLARAEPTVPIADTLRELGRTYELLGDHESAALCFSGAVPNALEHLPAGAALEPGVGDSTVPSEGSPASPIVDTPDSSAEAERGTAPANRSEGPPDANREKAPAVSDDGVADRRRFAPLPTTYRLTRLPTAGDTP